MRPSCLDCVRKHLAQASILADEALQGYPEHKWLAIGHLAEASAESLKDYPDLASRLHFVRKMYEAEDQPFDFIILLHLINNEEKEDG